MSTLTLAKIKGRTVVQSAFFLVIVLYLQFAPERTLLPSPEVFVLGAIFSPLLFFLWMRFDIGWQPSKNQLAVLFLIFVFFLWCLFGSIKEGGEYTADSFRRLVLGVGSSFIGFFSLSLMKPVMGMPHRLALIFIFVASFVSGVGLVMSFFGGGYEGFQGELAYQSYDIGSITLTHEVHFAGGFPRISSITANPNTLGFYAGMGCLLSFILLLSRAISKNLFFFVFLINGMALIHSYSRGAILAFLLTLFFVFFFYGWRRAIILVLLIFSLISITLFFFASEIFDFFYARSQQGLQGRDVVWENAIVRFFEKPFVGFGFGLEVENVHAPAGLKWTMHNAFLVVLIETGIIGFLLFLAIVTVILAALLKSLIIRPSGEHRVAVIICLSVCLFIFFRCMVETSLMRFTPVNYIFFVFAAMGMWSFEIRGKKIESYLCDHAVSRPE